MNYNNNKMKIEIEFWFVLKGERERVGLLKWVDSLFHDVYVLKVFQRWREGNDDELKIKIIKFKKINEATNALDIRYI